MIIFNTCYQLGSILSPEGKSHITHFYQEKTPLEMGIELLQRGVSWIQYRDKEISDEAFVKNALYLKKQCQLYSSVLIINDRVHLFDRIQPDGVHIGSSDLSLPETRTIIGAEAVLGYTVNHQEDINFLSKHPHPKVDYIGLGALHHTKTKNLTQPPLGYEGWSFYRQAIAEINPNIPVVAVGGVTLEDLPKLANEEANGVAISEALHQTENTLKYIQLTHQLF